MSIHNLIEKVKISASAWGESLEPAATLSSIDDLVEEINSMYSVDVPAEYVEFLKIVNGLEFNGLIIYGTMNSKADPDASPLDLIEMNVVLQDSQRAKLIDMIIIGEDSTGIIVYDNSQSQFQYRDRVGIDHVHSYSSFEDMLRVEVEKVM